MYDQAVTPGNLNTQQGQNTTNGTSGTFGTSNPSTPNTPMPQPSSFQSFEPLQAGKMESQAYTQGAQTIANAAQSSKSSGDGGLLGGILGIGSKILGFLAEGGYVGDKLNGFAQGGSVNNPHQRTADMGIAYLIGAHHQQQYGGTPDTLEKAKQDIQHMMQDKLGFKQEPGTFNGLGGDGKGGNVQEQMHPGEIDRRWDSTAPKPDSSQGLGFASGGDVTNADDALAQEAIKSALGLDAQSQTTANQAQAQPQNNNNEYIEPLAQGQQAPSQNQSDQQNQANQLMQYSPAMQNLEGQQNPQENPSIPNTGGYKQGGYMQPLAVGGPPIEQGAPMQAPPGDDPNGTPPLQPGQTFQGDGSVKGPGGPTDDMIPAKLSNGEFVFSQPAVQFFGVDKLIKMNEQGKQGFMQALNQVQANQPGGGQPSPQPPQAQQQPPQGQPVMQAKGGVTQTMMPRKNNAYMGV